MLSARTGVRAPVSAGAQALPGAPPPQQVGVVEPGIAPPVADVADPPATLGSDTWWSSFNLTVFGKSISNTTAKQLKIARESNVELEGKIEKTAKGTRLVICLQNYVRKMLQEKLEESARQLDALAKKNKTVDEEITLLRR